MKRYKFYYVALMLAGTLPIVAQEPIEADTASVRMVREQMKNVKKRPVSGRVCSVSGNTPLPGALVSVSGYEGYSTLTGEDGTYRLEVPEYATSLQIQAPDHNTVRVGINKSGRLRDVVMYSASVDSKYESDENILNSLAIR